MICAARIPALVAPALPMATVATGMPAGICTMESSESRPLSTDVIGTPMTGSVVSAAMTPAASVSGLYFSHPDARYFNVGRIGRDQALSYAERKGVPIDEVERWLSSNLSYEASDFAVKC